MDTLKNTKKDVFDTMEAIQYDPYVESEEEPRFKAPTNTEALKIWKHCGLLEEEYESFIYHSLCLWAENNHLLYKKAHDETDNHITWISDTNVLYTFKWITFLKWFGLACTRI